MRVLRGTYCMDEYNTHKIDHIFILDDSRSNNFICSRIIELSKRVEKVTSALSIEEANAALSPFIDQRNDQFPNIFLIDINLAAHNGIDFIENHLIPLKGNTQKEFHIYIISNAYQEEEENERIQKNPHIQGALSKPLQLIDIEDICNHYSEQVLLDSVF